MPWTAPESLIATLFADMKAVGASDDAIKSALAQFNELCDAAADTIALQMQARIVESLQALDTVH
jgi:hypothetical protein